MSQSQVSFDPKVAVIEPPRCSKCNCPTIFTAIRSGPSGLYLRIFECPLCGYTEKIAESWNGSGSRPRLLMRAGSARIAR